MDDECAMAIANNLGSISRAITADASAGRDETGGVISSLTEAVMGITAGLVKVADAISDLADAVRGHGGDES